MSKTPNYSVLVGKANTSMQDVSVHHDVVVSFSGKLVDQWGTGVGGKVVKLYLDGTYVTSESTAADGYWSFSFSFGTVGTHTAYVTFAGDASYYGCSTPIFTTVVSPG